MGDVYQYLEFRAQGRTRESKFRKSWKAVLCMLEDAAAVPSHNQPCEFSGEPRATFLMDFSPSKLRVASTHGDHTVRVSDVRTGKCTHILTGHPRTPWCLAFNPTSDDILASGCLAGEIRIWDLMGGGSEVLRNPCHGQVVTSLAFHPGGQVLAFASMNYIYFWDWSKDAPFAFTQTSQESERIRWLKFDPFGHYLYTGIGNVTVVNKNIVGAELEVSHGEDEVGDASDMEERRNQQQLNRARYQRLLERFMAFQQDRSRYRYGQFDSSRNPDAYDPNRARQSANRTRTDAEIEHDISLRQGHTSLNQSAGPSQAVGSNTHVGDDNRSGRRNLNSLSFFGRHEELQPRQRWGRYEPSFFTRPSNISDNSASARDFNNSNNSVSSRRDFSNSNSGASSRKDFSSSNNNSNLGSNNTNLNYSSANYQASTSDSTASLIGQQLSSSSQREECFCPYLTATLLPSENEAPAPSSASSFSQISSTQSRSENAASNGLDVNEFRILPVDQGKEGHRQVRNRSLSSLSLENYSSGPSYLQQRDELRSLLSRYMSRSSAGSSTSSDVTMLVTSATSMTSQSFVSSAETTADQVKTTTFSSVPLLAEAAQSKSLTAQHTRGKHLFPGDSNSTLNFDVLHRADNKGSCEIPELNTSISKSEHATCSRKGTPTSNDILEERNSFSENNIAMSDRLEDIKSVLRHAATSLGAEQCEDLNPLPGQEIVVTNVNPAGLNYSLLRHSESIPMEEDVLEHKSLSMPPEAASNMTFRPEDSSSSSCNTLPEQHGASNMAFRLEDSSSSSCNTVFSEYQDNTSRRPEPAYDSLSCSQETTYSTGRPDEGNQLHKLEAVASKNCSGQSSARIRFYDVASRRASRNAHNPDYKCQDETSKDAANSLHSNLLQDLSENRCINAMPNNFETTPEGVAKQECSIPHSRFDVTPRPESRKQNLLRRSRLLATSSWADRIPDSENMSSRTYDAAFRRTLRPEYYNPRLRHETAPRTHSIASHSSIHGPFSQSQALRNIRMAYCSHPWGHYEELEHRHPLSAFHDRQISRPVTDQTSQTLGAMKLPASSDQGTDVVGLNETPANLLQIDNTVEIPLSSLISGTDFNSDTSQRSRSPLSNVLHNTANINPSFQTSSGVNGSGVKVNGSVLRNERFQNLVQSVRAYLEGGYSESSPTGSVNYRNPESRYADLADFQVNRTSDTSERTRCVGIEGCLRTVNPEFASECSSADRKVEGERDESVGHATTNTAANQWNPCISLPFTVSSSAFVNSSISSSISTSHSIQNTSALHGVSEQIHSVPSNSNPTTSSHSASRAIQLFSRRNSDAPESDQCDANMISGSSTSFASNLVHRSLLSNTRNELSQRFHPYASALHHGRNPLLHRQLHTSRHLINNYSTVSDRVTMGMGATPEISTGNYSSENNGYQSSARNQPPSADATSRLRHFTVSDQPSAFSIFSTSNREAVTHQLNFRTSTSDFNPSSAASASYSASSQPQLEILSESSTRSSNRLLRALQDCGQNQSANFQETAESLGGVQQGSSRNVTWRTPAPVLSLANQVAVTEYLERRVMELDHRLSHLEQSYSSQLRELQQEYQWRRGQNDNTDTPIRLRGVNTGPYHDPRDPILRAETSTQASSSDSTTPPVQFRQLLECLRRQDPSPAPRISEADLPTSVTISQARDDVITVGRRQPWHALRQIHLHPDYSNHDRMFSGPISNLEYDLEISSNIASQTHRIQQWDVSVVPVPNISDASANIVVKHCRLHNDASCNLAQDGTLLATVVPGHRGFSDNNIIALFSLRKQNFAQCLYTKSFGPNAISVSISPLNRYVLVGLASRRMIFVTSAQMVGQVYRLVKEKAGESSMKHHKDIYHIHDEDRGNHVSVNSARWLPAVGEGLVYGTNKGDLHFFRAGSRKIYDQRATDDRESTAYRRRTATRNSIATQTTTVSIRRSTSTQTTSPSDEPMREERIITEGEES